MHGHHTPGIVINFYFDVFVEFVLYMFDCLFHTLALISFDVFIYSICLLQILYLLFDKYHFSFVSFCCSFYVCVCM